MSSIYNKKKFNKNKQMVYITGRLPSTNTVLNITKDQKRLKSHSHTFTVTMRYTRHIKYKEMVYDCHWDN